MPKQRAETIGLRLPPNVKHKIETLAQSRTTPEKRVYPSDVIREALARYFDDIKEPVSVEVNRGGNRRATE